MNNHFSNFRKVVCILLWPILVGVGQFLVVAILSFLFMQGQVNQMKQIYPTESEQQIIDRVSELDLSVPLNEYMESHMIYVILINVLIILPILIYQYRKYKGRNIKRTYRNFILLLFAPIAFCLLFHIPLVAIGVRYTLNNSSYFWMLLMSEGIVGPIVEEYLFRGVVYHKLKEIYSKNQSMIFCTVIFAFFHNNLLQIVFALLLGIILILLYEKYQDIKIPILFHCITNLVSFLLIPYLQNIHFLFTILLFIMSATILYCFYYTYKKHTTN